MDPFHPLVPGTLPHGLVADPMESVLSLQTLQATGVIADPSVPAECRNTNSCYTNMCETIGSTNVCSTASCSYGASNAVAAALGAR